MNWYVRAKFSSYKYYDTLKHLLDTEYQSLKTELEEDGIDASLLPPTFLVYQTDEGRWGSETGDGQILVHDEPTSDSMIPQDEAGQKRLKDRVVKQTLMRLLESRFGTLKIG